MARDLPDPTAGPTGDSTADPSAVLAAVAAVVPYLRATVLPDRSGDGADWHSCADLLADPPALAALIRTTGPGRQSDHPQVLASLFAQSYAFRVASVALAGWVLERVVIDPHPDRTAIAITRSRPGRLGLDRPEVRVGPQDDLLNWLVERLVVDHFRPFVATIRASTTVGERLLWGDIVASLVAVLRAVEGEVAPARKAAVRADAERFLAAADAAMDGSLAGLGAFVALRNEHGEGWFWERTTCCLWYRTQEGGWCSDCSLTPVGERRAAFLAGLVPAGPEAGA